MVRKMNISFEHIPGQSKTKRLLKNLLKTGRTPHALLITGRPGIGKKDIAISFAAGLMCFELAKGSEPCGKCTSCKRLISEKNTDLVFIVPDGGTIKIDQLRGLIPELKFKPDFSKSRVIILEDAEKMSEQAANALLKTLEEPPPGNVFILLSSDKNRLLPTIVSRCCHIKLEPLTAKELENIALERKQLEAEKARLCSMLANGSLNGLDEWAGEENIALWNRFSNWTVELKNMPMWKFFNDTKNMIDDFDSMAKFTYAVKVWLMLLIRKQIGGMDKGDITETELNTLLNLFEFVEESEQNLQFNVNKMLTAEEIGLSIKESLYGKDSWS